MNSENQKLGQTAVIVTILTLFSKVLGAGRDLTLSNFYGSSNVSDAYILATTIPVTIFGFIYEGIGASYIPVCSTIKYFKERNKLTSEIINFLLIITLVLVAVIEMFPEATVRIFASGFSEDTMDMAVFFTRVSVIGVFFSCVVYVITYYLHYHNSFIIPTIRAYPMDLVVIISIFLSAVYRSIIPMAIGIPLSLFVELLLVYPTAYKKGFRYSLSFDLHDKHLQNIIIWSLPIVLSTAITDLNTIIDRQFASWIMVGGISILTYSNRLVTVVKTALFAPVITVLFPMFSKEIEDGQIDNVSKMIGQCLSILVVISIPLTFVSIYFSMDIVNIVFGRGAFNGTALNTTYISFAIYSVAMLGYAILIVTTKVFYSLKDMKTPMKVSFIGVVVNVITNTIFSKIWGIYGLAAGTVIATFLMAILHLAYLGKIFNFENRRIILAVLKSFIATFAMAVFIIIFIRLMNSSNISYTISLILSAIGGTFVYTITLLFFKSKEVIFLLSIMRHKE